MPPPLARARERAIEALTDLLADQKLGGEEYARRVLGVRRAVSQAELERALDGLLNPPAATLPAAAPAGYGPLDDLAPDSGRILAILGGASRKGHWLPPEHLVVVAVMGGVELDFREAELPAEDTEVQIFTLMGGVEITVPPDLNVEVEGTAFMGGFAHRAPSDPDPDAPLLRVGGVAIMGGVEIKVKS